jgi:hypothetical protein
MLCRKAWRISQDLGGTSASYSLTFTRRNISHLRFTRKLLVERSQCTSLKH